jgi:spore germination protein GerM
VKRAVIVLLLAASVAVGCRKKTTNAANLNAANKVAVRMVRLYFETPQMLLAAEPRNIALAESPAAAIPVVVRELMKGPAAGSVTSLRLFPADTVVRGTYLLPGGTVVVDLGGATLTQGWGTGTHQELMAVYSLVQTLTTNFPDAKRVRIVVNGTPAETLAGHVSLSRSLVSLPSLVDPRSR